MPGNIIYGDLVTLDENNRFTLKPAVGTKKIVVIDKTGNRSAEMIVTVNEGHSDKNIDHLCDVCGAIVSEHKLKKIHAKDATVIETGNKEYWQCQDCGKFFSDPDGKNEIAREDTVITKLPPEIIEGTGQSITIEEAKEITFRSNAAFRDFIRVALDGKTLDEKYYTVKKGSTIITLKADYVATLSAGEHKIGIVSESGTATTTFTVNAKAAVDNDTKSLPTKDNSQTAWWNTLLFVSGCLLIVTGVNSKKKKFN